MKTVFTLKDLQNSKCAAKNPHLFEKPKAIRKPKKTSKEVLYITACLTEWCEKNNLEMRVEYKFHEYRKFRFDWCVPEIKLAMEYEGINSKVSRHTTMTGYTNDTEKYNLAVSEGWRILRFTILNYQNILQELEKFNE